MVKRMGKSRLVWMLAILGLAAAVLACGGLRTLTTAVLNTGLFRDWIRAEIRAQSDGRLEFATIEGVPWEVKLGKVAYTSPEDRSNIRVVEAESLVAHYQMSPLLRRRIRLTSLDFEGAAVTLKLQGGSTANISLPVLAEHVVLRNSTVVVQNLQGWTLDMKGVDLDLKQDEHAGRVSTTFTAKEALLEKLAMSGVQATVVFREKMMDVDNWEAALCGGTMDLEGDLLLEEFQQMHEVNLEIENLDIGQALAALGFSEKIGGKANLDIQVGGALTPMAKALSGSGSVAFRETSALVVLPLLPIPVRFLDRLREIRNLEGTADFQLSGQDILVSALQVNQGEGYQIRGSGTVGLQREINLNCKMYVSEALEEELPSTARAALERDEKKNYVIPFRLSGTTLEPRSNIDTIVTDVIMQAVDPKKLLKPADSLLNPIRKLFGGGEDREPEPATPPAVLPAVPPKAEPVEP
jgi:hypothetical protein